MTSSAKFLKISAIFLKIFSYVSIAIGIISALIIVFGKTPGTGKLASLGVLLISGIYAFLLYLASEIVSLLLDMDDRLQKMSLATQTPKREIR